MSDTGGGWGGLAEDWPIYLFLIYPPTIFKPEGGVHTVKGANKDNSAGFTMDDEPATKWIRQENTHVWWTWWFSHFLLTLLIVSIARAIVFWVPGDRFAASE